MKKDCDYCTDNGRCQKYDERQTCKPSSLEWFAKSVVAFEIIEADQVCRKSSIFGNYYFTITPEQIEQLKQGKVLQYTEEYGIFIAMAGGTE